MEVSLTRTICLVDIFRTACYIKKYQECLIFSEPRSFCKDKYECILNFTGGVVFSGWVFSFAMPSHLLFIQSSWLAAAVLKFVMTMCLLAPGNGKWKSPIVIVCFYSIYHTHHDIPLSDGIEKPRFVPIVQGITFLVQL